MQITYPNRENFGQALRNAATESLDFIVVVTAALNPANLEELKAYWGDCARALRSGGLLFVQGRPDYLPELGVYLDRSLNFKYWIALESALQPGEKSLPSVHAGLLLFTKGNGRFHVKRVRRPHLTCAFCRKPLKDWGGKAHLRHPDGYVISDVWADLPLENNYSQLSSPVLETVLQMVDCEAPRQVVGLVGPREGIWAARGLAESAIQYSLPGLGEPVFRSRSTASRIDPDMINVVRCGDALEILKRYPDNSVDLAFADPPYNLQKDYNVYEDTQNDEAYLAWCNQWLKEYARLLKPSGSLFVLNLPRWTMHHAVFLNQNLRFQNWIVWDALSEPRGKLMPAHYGLLWYTKHPVDFTSNYDETKQRDARYYCLRPACIRERKRVGADDKEPLTDFWRDIHRLKHKRDRDHHPCQLPDALMERIIRLATNPGDIVLDAMCGAGTTPTVAVRLGRQYIAIDVDRRYAELTRKKIAEVERQGFVKRKTVRKAPQKFTKKELQLELRNLAARLGRLPTLEDVRHMSRYSSEVFLTAFPSWGKALKAAKLEIFNG